jgi:hypothetical protein
MISRKTVLVLQLGLAATFLGHGVLAILQNPSWLPFLLFWGMKMSIAPKVMVFIGVLDVLIAILLIVKPTKPLLYWCLFWTVATALMRPLTGAPIWDFIERGGFMAIPLFLILNFDALFRKEG